MDRPLIDPPDEFAHIPSQGLVALHLWLADVNELIRRSGIGAASHTRCFIQLMRQDRAGSREKRWQSHRGSLGPESPPRRRHSRSAASFVFCRNGWSGAGLIPPLFAGGGLMRTDYGIPHRSRRNGCCGSSVSHQIGVSL